jgi:uncharacterized protein (TIGR02145 family)
VTIGDPNNPNTTVRLNSPRGATIHANFVRTFRLTIIPAFGREEFPDIYVGSFTPDSGGRHDANTEISIVATPNPNHQNPTPLTNSPQQPIYGYTFFRWEVVGGTVPDTVTFGNPYSAETVVTLHANATIIAVFHETFTDHRDGQTYRIVTIGTQTWMAENLNFASGPRIDNNPFGQLYRRNGFDGNIPPGWRLPDTDEWVALFRAVGNPDGQALKSTSASNNHWGSNNNGTDLFGFSALPGGCLNTNGTRHTHIGDVANWWARNSRSSSGSGSNSWGNFVIHRDRNVVEWGGWSDGDRYKSVRLLRNW